MYAARSRPLKLSDPEQHPPKSKTRRNRDPTQAAIAALYFVLMVLKRWFGEMRLGFSAIMMVIRR